MLIRRIVLGVDFSDTSLTAARWAATHFAPEAEVVLAHVLEETPMPPSIRAELPPVEEVATATAAQIHGGLRGLAQLIGESRCRSASLVGDPAAALASLAANIGADAICIGRARRQRGSLCVAASFPARLIAHSTVPTLVASSPRPGSFNRIVAAVDHRPASSDILETACALAAAAESTVEALHVVDPDMQAYVLASRWVRKRAPYDDDTTETRPQPADTATADSWLRSKSLIWVSALLDAANAASCRARAVIASGDPGSEILRHSSQRSADLLVVGGGGDADAPQRPGTRRYVGSTAQLVTWAAPCPVLVLPEASGRNSVVPIDQQFGRRRGLRPSARRGGSSGLAGPTPPAARRPPWVGDNGAA